ncbi:hypothetical protein BDV36DRAFT_38010 [Aspergillus pseudocaelatus]|uniref:Uncharacterized protein n=1 Tax=Aspergillus pseudocaelatus TaxID=1825620 RepID=A0ABQ6W854_9EURO|nr:hypothetical protein BDV36DRAFT_38010 [Aspergillus pseudocaelatus]
MSFDGREFPRISTPDFPRLPRLILVIPQHLASFDFSPDTPPLRCLSVPYQYWVRMLVPPGRIGRARLALNVARGLQLSRLCPVVLIRISFFLWLFCLVVLSINRLMTRTTIYT